MMRTKCGLTIYYQWILLFIYDHVWSVTFFNHIYLSPGFDILTSGWFHRRAFMDELALLQKIRHPNVVQFLGAVTQSNPMMIVTEYLPKVSVDL